MFIGHYGMALALKRAEPRLSLGTLFLATQLVDVLWGFTLLIGWERARIVPGYTAASAFEFLYYPITHSLVGGLAWALAAGAIYYSWPTMNRRHHARAAVVVGLAVLSHYVLDVVMHVPDLPLAGGDSPQLGLGLWRSLPATLALEFALLIAGTVLYLRSGPQRSARQRRRIMLLVGALAAFYLVSVFGPPPPTITAVVIGTLITLPGFVALAAWADRAVPDPARDPNGAGRGSRHTILQPPGAGGSSR